MNTKLTIPLLAIALVGCPEVPPADPLPTAPQILSFTSSASQVSAGDKVTLSWKVSDASSVKIDEVKLGTVSGVAGNEGSVEVAISDEALFVLTARNDRGASDTAVVAVHVGGAAGELRLSALPDTVNAGEPVTLAWSAPGATAVTLTANPGGPVDLGGQGSTGSVTIAPAATTTYTLSADSRSATATVTVKPTLLSFQASSGSADAGSTITLSWATANATRVQLSAGGRGTLVDETDAAKVAAGTFEDTLPTQVDPGQVFAYQLTVTGAGATLTREVVVSINGNPAVISFVAPKYSRSLDAGVADGGDRSIVLTWQTAEASAVSISADGVEFYRAPVSAIANGSVSVPAPARDTTYELVASAARGGVARKTAVVDVVGLPSVTLMATPNTIAAAGDPVTLSWSGSEVRKVRITSGTGLVYAANDVMDTGTVPGVLSFARSTELAIEADNGLGDLATATVPLTVTTPLELTAAAGGTLRSGQTMTFTWPGSGEAAGFAHRDTQVRNPSSGFIDISTTGTALDFVNSTDDDVAMFEPTFSAPFFDRVVGDRVWVSTNGYLSFSPVNRRNYSDVTIPTSKLEPYSIALNWDDSSVTSASSSAFWEVRTLADGVRVLIVMWTGISGRTFEAKVYSTGQVDLEYSVWTGAAGATGIQASGSWGFPLPTAPANNLGITFFAPRSSPLTVDVPARAQLAGAMKANGSWFTVVAPLDVVTANDFVVSEALPAPLPPLTASAAWYELFNNRDRPLELSGWNINLSDGGTGALAGTIAAGQTLVVGPSSDGALNDDAGVQLELPALQVGTPDAGGFTLARAGTYTTWSWTNATPGTAVVTDVGPFRLSTDTSSSSARALTCAATETFGAQSPTPQRGTPGRETGCGFPYRLVRIGEKFRDISSSGTLVPFTDYNTQTLPFSLAGAPFPFFGAPQTTVGVSTNGYLSFDGSTLTTTFADAFPSTTDANGLIVPFGDDLEGYWVSSEVYTQRMAANADPVTPAPHWIFQWHHWSHVSAEDQLDFEVKLFDDGVIELHYGDLVGGNVTQYASGSSAVAWLENPAGTQALVINTNSLTPGLTPHSAFRFVPR